MCFVVLLLVFCPVCGGWDGWVVCVLLLSGWIAYYILLPRGSGDACLDVLADLGCVLICSDFSVLFRRGGLVKLFREWLGLVFVVFD